MMRTTLVLLMLNLLAIFPNYIPAARRSTIFCRGTIESGLPSRVPRARACFIPALTRSRISFRSNCATAVKPVSAEGELLPDPDNPK